MSERLSSQRGGISYGWLLPVLAILSFLGVIGIRSLAVPGPTTLETIIAKNEPEDHAHAIGFDLSATSYTATHLGLLRKGRSDRWSVVGANAGDLTSVATAPEGVYIAGPTTGLVRVVGDRSESLLMGSIQAIAADSASPDRILVVHTDGTMASSVNGGKEWTAIGSNPRQGVLAAALFPGDPKRLALGGLNGFFAVSTDGGMQWSTPGTLAGSVSALVYDPDRSGRLWAAAAGAVYRSDDGGNSWRLTVRPETMRTYVSLAFAPGRAKPTALSAEGYVYELPD